MERITDESIAKTLESEKHLAQIQSRESSLLIPNPPENVERSRAITEIILQLEMVKQLARPLTDQERNVLMRLLHGTGETIEELKERAKKLLVRHTFGNIAFEHWMMEPETAKVKGDCIYCGAQWWGPPGMKCPTCYPEKVKPSTE